MVSEGEKKTRKKKTYREHFSNAKDSADLLKIYLYLSFAWAPPIALFMINVAVNGPFGSAAGLAAMITGAFAVNYSIQCGIVGWLMTYCHTVNIVTFTPQDAIESDLVATKPILARATGWVFAIFATAILIPLVILLIMVITLGILRRD